MLVIRIIVAILALLEVTAVLLSVLRSVVLPRAVPARLARLTFLIVRIGLLALRGRTDYATRVFGDIRINVVVAAVVCVGALIYLAVVRKPRETLVGPAALDDPDGSDFPDDEAEPPSDGAAAVVMTKASSDDPESGPGSDAPAARASDGP